MSLAMIEKWKAVEASPTQRFVGWILADAHNAQTGQCNPSVLRICQLTGYSDRAVAQAIQGLEEAGHLSVRRTTGGRSNYILHPRTTFAPEPGSPPKEVRGTPEGGSGGPPNDVRPTPERRSGKTGIEPEGEPEPTMPGVGEVDYSENGNPRMIDRIMAAYPNKAGRPDDARNALCRLAAEGADMGAILTKVKVHAARYEALPLHRRQYTPRIHTYFQQGGFSLSPDVSPWVHIETPKPGLPGSKPQSKKPEHAGYDIRPGVC